jgi:hypothetical protein
MVLTKRLRRIAAGASLAAIGIAGVPGYAHAWWRAGYGIGIWVPPIVVAPPPVYVPPPAYYPPPVVYAPPPARGYAVAGLDTGPLGGPVLGARPLVVVSQ